MAKVVFLVAISCIPLYHPGTFRKPVKDINIARYDDIYDSKTFPLEKCHLQTGSC